MAMILIETLVKRFGAFAAADGISLAVERGTVLGFLGPNGAGKSTTMKMIAGFLPPTSGSVRVCGHDVQAQPLEAKRRIDYLPEGAPTYPEMTPLAFLEFVARVRGLKGRPPSAARSSGPTSAPCSTPSTATSSGWRRR